MKHRITYSSNGEYILGGGNSKYLCLYDVKARMLLKKCILTKNRSLDGVLDKLNTKNLNKGLVMEDDSASDYEER